MIVWLSRGRLSSFVAPVSSWVAEGLVLGLGVAELVVKVEVLGLLLR
jgi:hypothetical protein